MILRPSFYNLSPVDKSAERTKLGLDPATPTALVLFGGYGSPQMVEITRRLNRGNLPVQLILICGRNEKLARDLSAMRTRFPKHVVGFTDEVPRLMQLSDFFIGKPGPGSISEALQIDLPVIVECNAWTLPQERYNAAWIREHGTGIVLNGFSGIAGAVEQMLDPARWPVFRDRAKSMQNDAVFEVPAILKRILDGEVPDP